MSLDKEGLLWQSLCDFYEGKVDRPKLEDILYRLKSNGGYDRFIGQMADYIALNEQSVESITKKFKRTDCAERRRLLLYMRGLRPADANSCDIPLFNSQKSPSVLPKLNRLQKAVLVAAFLDTSYTVLMDTECVPAPPEEPPWYYYSDFVEDSKETFMTPALNADYFQNGRILLGGKYEIGVTALWLSNAFTQITFVVDDSVDSLRDLEKWEYHLAEFGAKRRLAGPSIYVASRMLFHGGNHRIYRMIWPNRNLRPPDNGYNLDPMVRVLIYSRIFTQ